MQEEPLYFNALALALRSNYSALARHKHSQHSWRKAWQELKAKENIEPEAEWRRLQNSGVRLMLQEEDGFPELLRHIPLPPWGIYIKGSLPAVGTPAIGVVGTRKATRDGEELAREFAATLARSGLCIVSGLALGIDAAAHAGALHARGTTLAVLANGLDAVYPRTNARLAEEILQNGGALLSEYPLGSPALAPRFLERNRIISGLARALLIIEAGERSGSLATARAAAEQGRDVFVLPGPARHKNYAGSHGLIRDGAILATSAEEILSDLGMAQADGRGLSPEEELLLGALATREYMDADQLTVLTALPINVINQTLSTLVLRGKIKEQGAAYRIQP